MNFQLTKEQEFVRKMVREFATTEVEPIAADIDKEHRQLRLSQARSMPRTSIQRVTPPELPSTRKRSPSLPARIPRSAKKSTMQRSFMT